MRYFLFVLVVLLLAACKTNTAPVASFTLTPESGELPLEVTVTSTATDPDGNLTNIIWDWGDGSFNEEGESKTHTYSQAGTFTIKLRVTDTDRAAATTEKTVTVVAPDPEPEPDPEPSEPSGSLDKTFSEDGLVILEPRGGDTDTRASRALEVKADGRIVTAVNDVNVNTESFAVLAGLNADGSADESVNEDGFFFAEPFSNFNDLTVSEDVIHAVGNIAVETGGSDRLNCGFYLRLAADDTMNNQFCPGSPIQFAEIATDSSGRLVTAFLTTPPVGNPALSPDLILVRRLPNGQPDFEFGEFGTVTLTSPGIGNFLAGIVFLPGDELLVVVSQLGQNVGEGVTLARFSAEGKLLDIKALELPDVGVNTDTDSFFVSSVALDDTGKAILAGQMLVTLSGDVPRNQGTLVRLDPKTHELDKTFSANGIVIIPFSIKTGSTFTDLELDSNGRIVAVGTLVNQDNTFSFLVERHLPDGELDKSFGLSGTAFIAFGDSEVQGSAFGVDLAADGKIVVAGQVNKSVGVVRLNP